MDALDAMGERGNQVGKPGVGSDQHLVGDDGAGRRVDPEPRTLQP
jgi:hypothetical protein